MVRNIRTFYLTRSHWSFSQDQEQNEHMGSHRMIFVRCRQSAKCFCYFLVQTCGFFWLRKHQPFSRRPLLTVRLQHAVAAAAAAMATADMTALPLQQFIASLDSACLPKILQVCSGVYFQGEPSWDFARRVQACHNSVRLIDSRSVSGSVYEISGSEVCFSTGDLIKVIGIEVLSVCCEDVETNQTFELPISHTGLFQATKPKVSHTWGKLCFTAH